MSFSFGSHCWMPDFIPAVYARIVDQVPGMTRDRVFSSLLPDEDHLKWPPADRFVVGFMGNFPVDQRMVSGGGNLNTAFDSTLVLTAFCRLECDPETSSTQQLEDEVNGVWKFVQRILTALQTWEGPRGPDGLQTFRRPMRVAPGFRIERKSGGDRIRWATAPLSFEVSFVANLGFAFSGVVIP